MNETSVNPQNNIDEDEIDLKEVFGTLNRYKYSIVILAILFTIGATVFAYFKPNVYEATTTIELEQENRYGGGGDDMMSLALSGGGANLDNEQYILKSRFLSEKVLRGLDIGTRYFTTNNLRTIELYRSVPFVVISKELDRSLEGTTFTMQMLDEERFILSMTPVIGLKERALLAWGLIEAPADKPKPYTQEHKFGEEIVTEWFSLTIDKVFAIENREYSFTITPNEHMAGFIQGGLSTSLVSKSGTILKITFQDNVALRAQEIINTLSERYLQQELASKTSEADQTLEFIDAQIEEINKDVERSQGKLQKFRSKNTMTVDASSQAMMTAQNMAEYESKLQALEIESNVLKNVQEYMNTGKDLSGISLGSAAYTDPALAQMIQKLQESMMMRNSLLVEFTDLHPDVIKLTESINSIKSSIKFTLKNDINIIEQRQKTLRQYIRKYERSLQALPENERKLANLTRNTMVNENVYNFLLEQRAQTAILRSSTISKTRVIDSALLPNLPIKPKRLLIILVGMILGFIVGIALAFLRAFLDDTLKTAEDIDKITNIPLYGAVPQRKDKTTRSQFDEAMRVLRTNLQFTGGTKKSKVVALTSSISGEGKTTIAVALSKIIAATGKKVIILDLDMRRSRMHEEFSITNKVGVSSILSGHNTFEEAIQKDVEENLDVLTAGPKPPNPSELLVTTEFDELMALFSERYDYVILDTPPVGLVTDAMILLKMSDVGLIVTRANYSKKSFIKNIERFSNEHELQNLGFILNGLESGKNQGYGYGYGYGYGSGKGYYD